MTATETLNTSKGALSRHRAPITSAILRALPEGQRPKPVVACVTCPNGSWSLSENLRLTCLCAARRYMAWTPTTDGLIMCDDREAALAAQEGPA